MSHRRQTGATIIWFTPPRNLLVTRFVFPASLATSVSGIAATLAALAPLLATAIRLRPRPSRFTATGANSSADLPQQCRELSRQIFFRPQHCRLRRGFRSLHHRHRRLSLQPTIAAFNNLYSGCPTGSVPNTFWAYSTGTGNLQTAPVLSLDGTKLAMVETSAGGSILRLIKYANGEGTFDPVSKSWTVGAPAAAASWTTGACAGSWFLHDQREFHRNRSRHWLISFL